MSTFSSKKLKEYIETKAQNAFREFSYEVARYQTQYGIEKVRTLDDFAGHYWERNNGQLVERTRNIVDTGELRDSLHVGFPDKLRASLTWEADHAGAVYFGSISPGGYPIPPRPWVMWAHQDIGYENGYLDLFKQCWARVYRN
jgi:hypothetical protein